MTRKYDIYNCQFHTKVYMLDLKNTNSLGLKSTFKGMFKKLSTNFILLHRTVVIDYYDLKNIKDVCFHITHFYNETRKSKNH